VPIFPLEIRGGFSWEQITFGVPGEIHPAQHQIGVEQFLEMLCFDQIGKLEELYIIKK
jgi:hypothetical protein